MSDDEPIMLIDLRVKTDRRVHAVAERLGLTRNETLGALLCVWQLCYQNGSTDVHANDIDLAAGHDGFASAMLREELATHRDEGFLYIHGSHRAIASAHFKTDTQPSTENDDSSNARAYVRAYSRARTYGVALSESTSIDSPGEVQGDREGVGGKEGPARKSRKMTRGERLPATDAFQSRFRQKYNGLTPRWTGKEIKLLDDLIRQYGTDEVVRRVHVMFDHPPTWVDRPMSLGLFVSQWNLFAMTPNETKRAHGGAKHGRYEPVDRDNFDARAPWELTDEEKRRR